ncbi:hypothetical protein [Williamsia sp.]|uniref:hypothetical protein n=1 Tax=Williamsia sp. TaxID=1872085 RepID=UPI001A2EF6BA|nr:hypothetical protein [Williamsia sp.]MBJ7290270.1 hypothetical protein [Williamsia sp.]
MTDSDDVVAPSVSKSQFDQLNKALDTSVASAGSKDLRLEPGAAANAARACAQLLAGLNDAKNMVAGAANITGLGAFESDQQLRDKRLQPKAVGGVDSLDDVITRHITAVEKLRDLYIKAGKAYQEADFAGKQSFDHIDFDHLNFNHHTYNTDTNQEGATAKESVVPAK